MNLEKKLLKAEALELSREMRKPKTKRQMDRLNAEMGRVMDRLDPLMDDREGHAFWTQCEQLTLGRLP